MEGCRFGRQTTCLMPCPFSTPLSTTSATRGTRYPDEPHFHWTSPYWRKKSFRLGVLNAFMKAYGIVAAEPTRSGSLLFTWIAWDWKRTSCRRILILATIRLSHTFLPMPKSSGYSQTATGFTPVEIRRSHALCRLFCAFCTVVDCGSQRRSACRINT